MAPPVGGVGGMDALGAALAQRAPNQQPPGGAEAAGPGMGMAGQAADAQMQQLQQGMQQIRQVAEAVKLIGEQYPAAASTMQQVQQLLKQAIVEMAPIAPAQTGSGLAVPGGGMAP